MAKKGNFKLVTIEDIKAEDGSEVTALVPVSLGKETLKSTQEAVKYIKKNGDKFEGKTIMVIDLKLTVKAKVTQVQPKVELESL